MLRRIVPIRLSRILTYLKVYVTHDRKSFLNAGDGDLTDAWKYYWNTTGTDFALPILDNAFLPGVLSIYITAIMAFIPLKTRCFNQM